MTEQDPPPKHEVRWEQSDDRHAYEKLLRILFDPPKRQTQAPRPRYAYEDPEVLDRIARIIVTAQRAAERARESAPPRASD